jgi:hypothetical protein
MRISSNLGVYRNKTDANSDDIIRMLFKERVFRNPTVIELRKLQHASMAHVWYELLLAYKREQPTLPPAKLTNIVPVLMLFHNNEEYCRALLPTVIGNIQAALENLGFQGRFYMYENDSVDQTSKILKHLDAFVFSEQLQEESPVVSAMGRTSLRCNRIAFLRNAMVGWALPDIVNAPFVMCVDSNIVLSKNSVIRMFQAMSPGIVMATPNTVDASCPTHYYDTYAYTALYSRPSVSNILCPKEDCLKCGAPIRMPIIQKVNSAFGGACVLMPKALLNSFWSSKDDLCEHVSFCRHLAPGHVVVVRDAMALWLSSFKVYHEHKHVQKHVHALLAR